MSDEWWAAETEVEAEAGPPAVRKPRELDEVDKYRMPKTITAKWAEAQLSRKEWSDIKRTQGQTRLNPHLIEAMCRDATKGLSKRSIMARAGYSAATWNQWEAKAAQGMQPYALWWQSMMISVSSVEEELIDNVRLMAVSDFKAAKWMLEMINRDDYSPTPSTQILNVAGDVNETKSVNYLTDDEAVKVARLLQGFGAIPRIENVVEGEIVEDEDSDS